MVPQQIPLVTYGVREIHGLWRCSNLLVARRTDATVIHNSLPLTPCMTLPIFRRHDYMDVRLRGGMFSGQESRLMAVPLRTPEIIKRAVNGLLDLSRSVSFSRRAICCLTVSNNLTEPRLSQWSDYLRLCFWQALSCWTV